MIEIRVGGNRMVRDGMFEEVGWLRRGADQAPGLNCRIRECWGCAMMMAVYRINGSIKKLRCVMMTKIASSLDDDSCPDGY